MIILTYLGKMVLCSAILLGYYWLFLRNKRFHHYNRFYLLGTLVLSLVLPWVRIPVFEDTGMLNQMAWRTAQAITIRPEAASFPKAAEEVSSSVLTFSNLLWVLYGAGLLVCLVLLTLSLRYILRISRRYPFEQVHQLRIYQTREPGTPFSFFRSIFWNEQLNLDSQQGQQIFRHELFHVQQKHSVDILLAELITIVGWFNPFFHLIKKELRAIHEFLADQYAASGDSRYQYAELLVQQVLASRQTTLTHPFFQNHLKRRIAMITQHHASRYGYWSRLMVLPLSATLFFSITLYAREKHAPAVDKMIAPISTTEIIFLSFRVQPDGQPGNLTFYPVAPNTQGQRMHELSVATNISATAHLSPEERKQFYQQEVTRVLKQLPGHSKVMIKTGGPHFMKITFRQDAALSNNEVQLEADASGMLAAADTVPVEVRKNSKEKIVREVVVEGKRTPAKTTAKVDEVVVVGEYAPAKTNARPDEVVVVGRKMNYTPKDQLRANRERQVVLQKVLKEQATTNQDMAAIIHKEINVLKTQEKELRDQQEQQVVKEVVVEGRPRIQVSYAYAADSVQKSLTRYFYKNFHYPQELIDNNGEGSVWYSFFTGPDGSLWNFKVYHEAPANAARIQEIVIVGYANKAATGTLSAEKKQELFKQEVLRVLEKSTGAVKVNTTNNGVYYYKATFRLEEKK